MTHTLSEHESKRLLAAAGIAVAEERLVATVGAAADAADELGYPVVIKLCGRGIVHKTERGLVRLDLRDANQVRTHADELLVARGDADSEASILVQRMVTGRRELIAGLFRDPQFGPCVMLGLGGIFAEVLGDAVFAVAPLAKHDATDLINSLANQRILGPFRGEPAIDRSVLARILDTLGSLGSERHDIVAIDMNPLVVCGAEPVVVDALVELEGPG